MGGLDRRGDSGMGRLQARRGTARPQPRAAPFIAVQAAIQHITKSHIDTGIRHLYPAVTYLICSGSDPGSRRGVC
jgi:hypothetical protein